MRHLIAIALLAWGSVVLAEGAAEGTLQTAPEEKAAPATDETLLRDFRDTSRYTFPAVAQTTFDMQLLAYAMQLREYCANRRISDEFVRDRLLRFSAMTGREEDCTSLLDY